MNGIIAAFADSLAPVHEIELVKIEPDAEQVARHLQRVKELRESMGPTWIGHSVHAAQHRHQEPTDVRVTIMRARAVIDAVRQHQNVRELKRKARA